LINMVRSLAAEFGISIARAIRFSEDVIECTYTDLPELEQDVLRVLILQRSDLHNRLGWYEITKRIQAASAGRRSFSRPFPVLGLSPPRRSRPQSDRANNSEVGASLQPSWGLRRAPTPAAATRDWAKSQRWVTDI
jgi:hypothetical protein